MELTIKYYQFADYNLIEVPREYTVFDKCTNVYDKLLEFMEFKPERKYSHFSVHGYFRLKSSSLRSGAMPHH